MPDFRVKVWHSALSCALMCALNCAPVSYQASWWVLRYRQTINQGGELKTVQPAVRLVPVSDHYKTRRSVRDLVREKLTEINRENQEPETVVTLGDFWERAYLAYVKAQKRPSTALNYEMIWKTHLQARLADVLMRRVRVWDVQGWLETIAREDRGRNVSHSAMPRCCASRA